MKTKWEQVGECGVDSGSIIIGDPCYFAYEDAKHHPAKTWSEYCAKTPCGVGGHQLHFAQGHSGLAVVVDAFGGDGCYPVYIRRDDRGFVTEAKIVFRG